MENLLNKQDKSSPLLSLSSQQKMLLKRSVGLLGVGGSFVEKTLIQYQTRYASPTIYSDVMPRASVKDKVMENVAGLTKRR